VQVDSAVGGGGRFWTASEDGSKAFFTKGDLYEYDLEDGHTIDLTPGVEVVGVIGASDDGEYVYYADSNGNLNVWHDGVTTFIATLTQTDGVQVGPYARNQEEHYGDWVPGLSRRTAEVTGDGHAVVFVSGQSLKVEGFPNGYPNEGREEVYVYETEGNRLFCASCSPSGEPGAAGFLQVSYSATHLPRWISADGSRVFFDSFAPLVAQDTNGKIDVYEWERDGAGSCHSGDGCIYLLSGGTSGSASWLLDASESGNDVFIISRAELVPGDPYDSFDVYDARVSGVQPLAPPACSGTGCQGVPPAPPIFSTPASVTFGGVGNFPPPTQSSGGAGKAKAKGKSLTRKQQLVKMLKACKRKRWRTRAECEGRARKRYAAKSSAGKPAKGRR
jgi:hypothetical protein